MKSVWTMPGENAPLTDRELVGFAVLVVVGLALLLVLGAAGRWLLEESPADEEPAQRVSWPPAEGGDHG